MIYHGSDNPSLAIKTTKIGGYHIGAGPVEFLGPSFSTNKAVSSSYGKYLYESGYSPRNPKIFKSMNSLRKDILKTFGYLKVGDNVGDNGAYYKDIAENYRIKLQVEGYDAVVFKEGPKDNPLNEQSLTIIPVTENLPTITPGDR